MSRRLGDRNDHYPTKENVSLLTSPTTASCLKVLREERPCATLSQAAGSMCVLVKYVAK